MVDSANKDCVSENGILQQEEFRRYKSRSISTKFKQQLFLGIGGATVFGLAGALGTALLHAGTAMAFVGLGGLAVVGLAAIYLGSKYLSESIMLDQDFQAKKIGRAARGPVQEPEVIQEQEKGGTIAPVGTADKAVDLPANSVSSVVALDRVAASEQEKATTENASFADKALASKAALQDAARA